MSRVEKLRSSAVHDIAPDIRVVSGVYSAREAADLLGVHERTIRRAIQNGHLAATRTGRAFSITAESLHTFWESRQPRGRIDRPPAREHLILLPRPEAPDQEPAPRVPAIGRGYANSLPRPTTSFVGREREVATLIDLLREPNNRLVTVLGPGGVGKTRLATTVAAKIAAEFDDGAFFVGLSSVTDPAMVMPAIAHALGVQETSGRDLVDTLIAALRDRRFLLVLDNFEHVREAGVSVARLLGRCPGISVLVTSRESLRVGGERQFLTPPLSSPSPEGAHGNIALTHYGATALFVERARAARPDFSWDPEDARAIAMICRRLDGLPLAIELAAPWVRILPPQELLGRLEPRLALLHGGPEDQPDRLRTMRNAIAWSYDLLSPEEAHFFRRLAVFTGGFTLESAESMAGHAPIRTGRTGVGVPSKDGSQARSSLTAGTGTSGAPSALTLVASLVDKSLLQSAPTVGGETRFTMLETVREFALEQLAAHGEVEEARAVHLTAMLEFAERAEPHLLGPQEQRWMERCRNERDNLRGALAWALDRDAEAALRIAAALWVYWSVFHLGEGRNWLRSALARSINGDTILRARALTVEAALACLMGDFAAGEAAASEAAVLLEAAGEALAEARARWVIAANRLSAGEAASAALEADRALALFEQATTPSDRARIPYTRWTRAAIALIGGDTSHGIALCEQALAEVRASGSHAVALVILSDYAGWLIGLGEISRARQLLAEALSLATDQSEYFMAIALVGLAQASAIEGLVVGAAQYLGAMAYVQTRFGLVFPAHVQLRIDEITAHIKADLGDDSFAQAWHEGWGHPNELVRQAMSAREPVDQTAAVAPNNRQGLTRRERDVLRLLVAGYTDKEIAAALAVSRATASRHVGSIRAKLRAPSRSAAVAVAVRDGLA